MKVKIYYDDDVYSIVDKLNDIISHCGIEIIEGDSGDGWSEFMIKYHDQSGEDICEHQV